MQFVVLMAQVSGQIRVMNEYHFQNFNNRLKLFASRFLYSKMNSKCICRMWVKTIIIDSICSDWLPNKFWSKIKCTERHQSLRWNFQGKKNILIESFAIIFIQRSSETFSHDEMKVSEPLDRRPNEMHWGRINWVSNQSCSSRAAQSNAYRANVLMVFFNFFQRCCLVFHTFASTDRPHLAMCGSASVGAFVTGGLECISVKFRACANKTCMYFS